MPRTDDDGNLEFHPIELPKDYHCGADPENPFIREKEPEIITRRICLKCDTIITLHVPFDPTNKLHSLCDECILELPKDPNVNYPENTYQTMNEAGESIGGDEL